MPETLRSSLPRRLAAGCLVAVAAPWLAGCEQLGIPTPAVQAAKAEAEAKAVGAACRHAGRAIEDCYTLNRKASKAPVYAGWREMDDHMRENKIEPVAPVIPRPDPAARRQAAASAPAAADGDAAHAAADDAGAAHDGAAAPRVAANAHDGDAAGKPDAPAKH